MYTYVLYMYMPLWISYHPLLLLTSLHSGLPRTLMPYYLVHVLCRKPKLLLSWLQWLWHIKKIVFQSTPPCPLGLVIASLYFPRILGGFEQGREWIEMCHLKLGSQWSLFLTYLPVESLHVNCCLLQKEASLSKTERRATTQAWQKYLEDSLATCLLSNTSVLKIPLRVCDLLHHRHLKGL